ncbi:energy-coupling factor transporter transmembrane protein EcfT [Thermoanaerobacteraceae bacterium SP2]|nr:energy-coupling factor transporter transmembrane protein EcfT [Thermoanaerobacteraceae bacterium SP2]
MNIDIRTRLLISALFSGMALIYQKIEYLLIILIFNILTLVLFKIRIKILFSIKKLLYISITMIVIQSMFVRTGHPLLKPGGICLLTDDGIIYGAAIFLRFIILILSGMFILNSNISQLTRGLVKLGMPFEIAFMIQLGVRFVPVFFEEMGEILNSIQLRGVDLRKIYKRKVIKVYVSIFSPVIYSVWDKAEKLAILLELRGFRTNSARTYYREVCFKKIDYVIMILYLLWAAVFVGITL